MNSSRRTESHDPETTDTVDASLVKRSLLVMSDDLKKKTAETAKLYFDGYEGPRPFDLWRSFDKDLAKDLSLFITGKMYSREKISHQTRQLISVAALTALERKDELKLHIYAALNVGCKPDHISEVIFQCGVYAGMPVVNTGLKILRETLEERGEWPPRADE
jgi:4-carboxymuconolactone decarboxylase